MKPSYSIISAIVNLICMVLALAWFTNSYALEPLIVFIALIIPFVLQIIQIKNLIRIYLLTKKPSQIDQVFLEIDRQLLDLERSLVKKSDKKIWYKTIDYFLDIKSKSTFGISYKYISRGLKRESFYDWVSKLSPSLFIKVNKNFKKVKFTTANNEHAIKKPSLLWDCTCYAENSKVQCPIHFGTDGEYNFWIGNSFSNGYSNIKWRGMNILWKGGIDLWPPSFDLLKSLDSISNFLSNFRINSIYEYWSNTGAFGIYLLKNFNSVSNYYHYNQFLRASLYTNINLINNGNSKYIKNTILFNELKNLDEKVDLFICQPPYLYDYDGQFQKIRQNSLVGDNKILFDALSFGANNAQRMILVVSQMIFDKFKIHVKELSLNFEIIHEFKSVFRISEAFRHTGFIDNLLNENRIFISSKKKHKYYHKIFVVHVY